MELSIFLAKLLGLYFIIIAILFAFRREAIVPALDSFMGQRGYSVLTGSLKLLAGLAIAIGHSVWVWGWPVVITLIGYFAIIRGLVELGFPEYFERLVPKVLHDYYWVVVGVVGVLGVFLTYFGFTS